MLTVAANSESRLFLIKSVRHGQKFANMPGFYLHNGRWKAVAKHGPAPKGAPQAAHPHAAGQHKPVTLTPEQVEQLKYPADKASSNSEMAAFNEKHLPSLLAHAAAGDATAILGHGFGTNTHAKKKAAIANFLLSQMGSAHQVQAGQAAGEHAAVKQERAAPQPVASAPEPAPAPSAPEQAAPAPGAKMAAGKPTITHDGKEWSILSTGSTNAEGKIFAHLASATEGTQQKNGFYPVQMSDWVNPADIKQPAQADATASATTTLTAPEFQEGKTTKGVKDYYDKKAAAIIAMAQAGDVAGLKAMPTDKGNSWQGKTPNSKKLLELHAAALSQAKNQEPVKKETPSAATSSEPSAVAAPESIKKEPRLVLPKAPSASQPEPEAAPTPQASAMPDWDAALIPDSNSNAKSHNGIVGKIKAMAEAGDVDGLTAVIDAKHGAKQTYAKKQLALAQAAMGAMQAAAPVATAPELPAAEPGPKDGDTMPGADGGTLVFKDGRWHKQEAAPPVAAEPAAPAPDPEPQPAAEPVPTGLDAVQIPDFTTMDPGPWGKRYAMVAAELKAAVEANGAAGLKGKVINHADGRITIKAAGFHLKKLSQNEYPSGTTQANRREAMHKLVADLKAAAGKPAKAKKSAAAPAPAPTPSGPPSMDAWTQTGPQGGSNPGGRFKDESGQEWYCKFPADPEAAKSEVLAARLYAAAGLASQDAMLVTKGGKIGIASKWVSVSNAGGPATLAKVEGAQSGFAVDAWLANWDVVGLGYDNLQMGPDGKAVRIDAGGSLEYRAQGSKKPFGPKVDEIESLRDKSKNPQAAAVFGGMTDADITASAAKVAAITPAQIRALVADHGPGDQAAKKALADTLIARRDDLLARFPKADKKTAKKRLDPTALPVDPSVLPKPHDFNNWSGTGKPLSSKQHLNDANLNVEHEMLAAAKQGNLPKLQAFEFHVIDKDTGLPTGATKPINQHPSKHVVQFHSDLVQTLDEIANPPQPLKIFRETDVGSLAALDAAFPPKPFGTTVSKVSSTEKLGFRVALGAVSGDAVNKLKPQKTSDYSSAAIAAAKTKFAGASALAKHFIHRIQQSGSYNDLFRNGKEYDNDGNKLADVAKAALAHATEMPEGTTLYRYQKMTPAMIDHIMSAKDGTVFQATGPMCTSYHPTATSGFGSNRVVIRYAKGAKAVESFASGGYAGEKEVTTLPNARFVILSKTKKPGGNLDLELLMLPPDIGL